MAFVCDVTPRGRGGWRVIWYSQADISPHPGVIVARVAKQSPRKTGRPPHPQLRTTSHKSRQILTANLRESVSCHFCIVSTGRSNGDSDRKNKSGTTDCESGPGVPCLPGRVGRCSVADWRLQRPTTRLPGRSLDSRGPGPCHRLCGMEIFRLVPPWQHKSVRHVNGWLVWSSK